jgi:hypothetical protein
LAMCMVNLRCKNLSTTRDPFARWWLFKNSTYSSTKLLGRWRNKTSRRRELKNLTQCFSVAMRGSRLTSEELREELRTVEDETLRKRFKITSKFKSWKQLKRGKCLA